MRGGRGRVAAVGRIGNPSSAELLPAFEHRHALGRIANPSYFLARELSVMGHSPHDPHCIFCKIAAGTIPSAKILETAEVMAFLDINPVNRGHTLLVPKAHHAHLSDLPEALAAATGSHLPRLCRAIRAATGADGLNVIVNNGEAAGQTIDHCHWHIIPRFVHDDVKWPWPHSPYVADQLEEMKSRIEHELHSHP